MHLEKELSQERKSNPLYKKELGHHPYGIKQLINNNKNKEKNV
tara:strand:- start:388 stop:516 length:129 start_codon:yes stop_codon:yes gene_type:complete